MLAANAVVSKTKCSLCWKLYYQTCKYEVVIAYEIASIELQLLNLTLINNDCVNGNLVFINLLKLMYGCDTVLIIP